MLFRAFRSEWLKRKRSSASLLLIGGSLFTSAIIIAVRLLHWRTLPALYAGETFWRNLWTASWESMAVFFLPMTAILSTSLVTQIEYRGNAWKQVRTLPLSDATLFLAKLAVIVVMMVQFLAFFSGGIYVSAMLPALLVPGVPSQQAYDISARETIRVGKPFTYLDRESNARRRGFYDPASNRFTAVTQDGKRITTHFRPDNGERYAHGLTESTYR